MTSQAVQWSHYTANRPHPKAPILDQLTPPASGLMIEAPSTKSGGTTMKTIVLVMLLTSTLAGCVSGYSGDVYLCPSERCRVKK